MPLGVRRCNEVFVNDAKSFFLLIRDHSWYLFLTYISLLYFLCFVIFINLKGLSISIIIIFLSAVWSIGIVDFSINIVVMAPFNDVFHIGDELNKKISWDSCIQKPLELLEL